MITIRKPLSFTEIGRKDNQEDYLYPSKADENSRVFIMCDGMGGHDNGEVASKTVANALGDYLTSCSKVDVPTFDVGLQKAYDALDDIDTNSAKKPGTTMTCLCLNEDSYLVAHIGDSRIYHIRPSLYNPEIKRGGIIYQSSDHSLVNDLLRAGELTEEEARVFPQKNVITRAMQPHLANRFKVDVYIFNDIQDGDYFFLCCDGVLEQLTNDDLSRILSDKKMSDAEKLCEIKSICDGKTRDNYTCWLVPIDKAEIKASEDSESVILAVEEDAGPANINNNCKAANGQSKNNGKKRYATIKIPVPHIKMPKAALTPNTLKWLIAAIVVLILGICAFTAAKHGLFKALVSGVKSIIERYFG